MSDSLPALLLDEQPLVLQRRLIRLVGSHEAAALLQQVHYRSRIGSVHDGNRWAVATNAEWADDIVSTERTVERLFSQLVRDGLIVREAVERSQYRRTKWSRIDYAALADRLEAANLAGSGEQPPFAGFEPAKVAGSIPTDVAGSEAANLAGSEAANLADSSSLQEKEEPVGEEQSVAANAAPGDARSGDDLNRLTKQVVDGYWEFVRAETGKPPVGITHVALQNVIRPFLKAGYEVVAVKHAMKAVRDRGQTFTRQILEQHLDGRAAARRPAAKRGGTVTDVVDGARRALARAEAEEHQCHRRSA